MGNSNSTENGIGTLTDHEESRAQVAVDYCKTLKNLKFRCVSTLNQRDTWIRGFDVTPDGKVLLTLYSDQCLNGITADGNHLFTISTSPNDAFDVTCINDTTVAVTSGWDQVITIVDIGSRTVNKHIDIGYPCYGVTYKDWALLVCAEGQGILSINLSDEKITTIVQCDDLSEFSYITTHNDKLYYTDMEIASVTCCNMAGNTLWTFKEEGILFSPRGITTDKEGRLYVCDYDQHEIIVLSPNGKESETILSRSDFIYKPCAIHFDKERKNIMVSNKYDKLFVFNLLS